MADTNTPKDITTGTPGTTATLAGAQENVLSPEKIEEANKHVQLAYLDNAKEAAEGINKNTLKGYNSIAKLKFKSKSMSAKKFDDIAHIYPTMSQERKICYIADLAVNHPEEFEKLKEAWGKKPPEVFTISGNNRDIALIPFKGKELEDMRKKYLDAQNREDQEKKDLLARKEAADATMPKEVKEEESFWDRNKDWIVPLLCVVAGATVGYFIGRANGGSSSSNSCSNSGDSNSGSAYNPMKPGGSLSDNSCGANSNNIADASWTPPSSYTRY